MRQISLVHWFWRAAFILSLLLLAGQPSLVWGGSAPLIYLPFVTRLPSTDLTITGLEVIQAIQTASNSVPLIAGKPTVVRISAITQTGTPPTNVTVSLNANREGVDLGTLEVGIGTIPATTSRSDYASTFNALLPSEWASGNVQLTAVVDALHVVPEASEINNQASLTAVFHDVPPLQLMLVPINYTHQGSHNPGFYPAQAVDHASPWLLRVYPLGSVAVTFHAPFAFTGDLQTSAYWTTLLEAMRTLRTTDGRPDFPMAYQALVPIDNGATLWFSSGIAGRAYIGRRESVALYLGNHDSANFSTGLISGHEIGHNLGRKHTPCGNPDNPDPQYPYAGASIGEYGLEIDGTNVSLKTPANVDFMSYCNPRWISDYTYNALYQDQLIHGLVTEQSFGPSLLIRVQLSLNGAVALRPLYLLPAYRSPEPATSPYQAQLLNAQGEIIATHGLAVTPIANEGVAGVAEMVMGVVPLPKETVTAVRLLENGVVVSQENVASAPQSAVAPVQLSQTADGITLQWGDSAPAVVRYTVDNGRSWTTYAIDLTDHRLTIPLQDLPLGQGLFQILLANSSTVLTAVWSSPLPTP